jgi:hypothetical protein
MGAENAAWDLLKTSSPDKSSDATAGPVVVVVDIKEAVAVVARLLLLWCFFEAAATTKGAPPVSMSNTPSVCSSPADCSKFRHKASVIKPSSVFRSSSTAGGGSLFFAFVDFDRCGC